MELVSWAEDMHHDAQDPVHALQRNTQRAGWYDRACICVRQFLDQACPAHLCIASDTALLKLQSQICQISRLLPCPGSASAIVLQASMVLAAA